MLKSATDVVEHVKWQTIRAEKRNVKRYFNTTYKLSQLNKGQRLFLDFLLEQMDKDNLIVNSKVLRNQFNALLKHINQPTYTHNYITRSFKQLTAQELLLSTDNRGIYRVNPIYFFKGTEAMRVKLIKEQAQRDYGTYVDYDERKIILDRTPL